MLQAIKYNLQMHPNFFIFWLNITEGSYGKGSRSECLSVKREEGACKKSQLEGVCLLRVLGMGGGWGRGQSWAWLEPSSELDAPQRPNGTSSMQVISDDPVVAVPGNCIFLVLTLCKLLLSVSLGAPFWKTAFDNGRTICVTGPRL